MFVNTFFIFFQSNIFYTNGAFPFTKIIAPATCRGVIFVFSCGRSHILFTCCCNHTLRVGHLPLKKFRLLLFCRNALKHFVHWRLLLLLFLNEVPHGRDINHLKITSFFVLHPTYRRLALRVRRSFSLPFGFTLWRHTNHNFVPPFSFSPFCY